MFKPKHVYIEKEALDYALQLCKNKDDGSYVMLHRVDGKLRKY